MCPSDRFWGDCTVAAPTSLSTVFPIKTGEKRAKKRDGGSTREKKVWRPKEKKENWEKKETEEQRKKSREKQKRKKEKKKDHRWSPSTQQHRCHRHSRQKHCEPPYVSLLPFPFLLLLLLRVSPLFTLHVNSGETHCLHGPADPAQPKTFGPGSAHFKKKFSKFFFKKNCNFSVIFSTFFFA